MLDVSHFELVYKPQSPQPPADTVLQGYFLEISNLEDRDYLYQLEFVTSVISDPNRSLASNAAIFVDTPSTNNNIGAFSLVSQAGGKSYRLNRFITIPAHGTALVAMLPSDPFAMPGGAPNFECRGYVKISLPALFQRVPGRVFGRFVPQSNEPVNIMLTPQNRATYLGAGGAINDQTQSSVPVASGKAVNALAPSTGGFIIAPGPVTLDLNQFDRFVEIERPSANLLAGLLGQVAAEGSSLAEFNSALAKAGVPIAIEHRKAKSAATPTQEAVS